MNSAADPAIWLCEPEAVWTGTDENADNGLVIAGNRILELVPQGASPHTEYQSTLPVKGQVLMPGLINCHHHFYQTLTRALPAAQNLELFGWLQALYPVWAGLDSDSIYQSTRLALAELLLSGCTTASDHHYLFSDTLSDAIDTQIAAASELGARVVLTRGSMSLGKSDGGLPPDTVIQDSQTILADSESLLRRYHDPADDAMLQLALAPCSPFSVSAELMRESAALARRHGVLLHTHLGETEDENRFCLDRFGLRPLDYLESVDWLADDVWLAHGIHFTAEEMVRMGRAGVAVCHCPSSNMILASGICHSLELEEAGVVLGLGVDGSASNDHSNMMQEVRQAFLLQRLRYGSARVRVNDALRWATAGGAKLLHRSTLGQLKAGAVADLALFDLDELRFSGVGDALTALVTSGAHRARNVMVNGQWRVRDYELQGIDLGELRDAHRQAARRLLSRQVYRYRL